MPSGYHVRLLLRLYLHLSINAVPLSPLTEMIPMIHLPDPMPRNPPLIESPPPPPLLLLSFPLLPTPLLPFVNRSYRPLRPLCTFVKIRPRQLHHAINLLRCIHKVPCAHEIATSGVDAGDFRIGQRS